MRYADDCNIYVRSEQAGQRVMGSLTRFLEGMLFGVRPTERRAKIDESLDHLAVKETRL